LVIFFLIINSIVIIIIINISSLNNFSVFILYGTKVYNNKF